MANGLIEWTTVKGLVTNETERAVMTISAAVTQCTMCSNMELTVDAME